MPTCVGGRDETVTVILGEGESFLAPLPPVSDHFTRRILGRAQAGIERAESFTEVFDPDTGYRNWLEKAFSAMARIIDTKMRVIQQERDLRENTACLHIDLFLIETMMEHVRCRLQYAFEQKRFNTILELEKIMVFLNNHYEELIRGARDNAYVDEIWQERHSFDQPYYCCKNSYSCEAYYNPLLCGGDYYESIGRCMEETGCGESLVCPFHSDYLPPTTVVNYEPDAGGGDSDDDDSTEPDPGESCTLQHPQAVAAACVPDDLPYDFCSTVYGAGWSSIYGPCDGGTCYNCGPPHPKCHELVPYSTCLSYSEEENHEKGCRQWCEGMGLEYSGSARSNCYSSAYESTCCKCKTDYDPQDPGGSDDDDDEPPRDNVIGYGCDLSVLEHYKNVSFPGLGDAIKAEYKALKILTAKRDAFIAASMGLKNDAINLEKWMGREPPDGLEYFGATIEGARKHHVRLGCNIEDGLESRPPPQLPEDYEELKGLKDDPEADFNEFWPPKWPSGAAKWEKRGPFSFERDDVRLLREYNLLREEWGKKRPIYYKLPENFGLIYFMQLYARGYFKRWDIHQEQITGPSVAQATDAPLEIHNKLEPVHRAVAELASYATMLSSGDEMGGIRDFVRGLAYFLRRMCLNRPCNDRLECILVMALESACFPYTSGGITVDAYTDCKDALKDQGYSQCFR